MSSRHSPEHRYIRLLLTWRWLIVAFSLVFVVLIETSEGHAFDLHAWSEIIVFGLVLPFATWLMLTLLARAIIRRNEIEHDLQLHRQLTQQLARHRNWQELSQFVVQFPGTILPVERACLYIYDHRRAQLKLAVEWPVPRVAPSPARTSLSCCLTCLLSPSPKMCRVVECALLPDSADGHHSGEYCLPLSYHHVLVGSLRMWFLPERTPAPDRVQFINAVAPEIALALALSIAEPRQMAQVRVEAQVDERRRIAFELHSSLAQQIGFLHLNLDRLIENHAAGAASELRPTLEKMREVANEAYENIRGKLALLRAWEKADLPRAIAEHLHAFARDSELNIELRSDGDPVLLQPRMCQSVFNLIQEGLVNVDKHAGARHVEIVLTWREDRLRIDLSDDGKGFDPQQVPEGHFGLALMRERAAGLNGTMRIESAPDEGARLIFEIPLTRESDPEKD